MTAKVAAGAEVRVAITAVDEDGAGVGVDSSTAGGAAGVAAQLAVHVPATLPGELVRARIAHVSTHGPRAWASLLAIEQASAERVAPKCRAHGSCGGCVLQHWSPTAQLAWKEQTLRVEVAADPVLGPLALPVTPAVASPSAFGYRNNSKLVTGWGQDGRLVLGGYAPRSHRLVDLDGCAVVEPALAEVASALRGVLEAAQVAPYDEQRLTGVLRYAILRANAEGQVLVTLVTASEDFPGALAVAERLRQQTPAVAGVVQNVNPTRGNVLYGDREHTLAGTPFLEDRIGEVRLRLSSRAFFQANRRVAALAYQAIATAVAATPTDRVVDAYAGVGGIALTLAPRCRHVWGIEDHPAAAADATLSAGLNGVTNATFVAGDAGERLEALLAAERTMDIVVLNPPRRGCDTPVLRHTAALRPRRIAYLSCSPPTLLRDLGALAALGYRTLQVTPFDMLPHTPHLEALAVLAREG
jgi:23S rRNA (uracil1939-C5)-methyltransferase